MKAEKIGVGVLYAATGAMFTNALWLFPQSGENHVSGVIFVAIGIAALILAIAAHGEE